MSRYQVDKLLRDLRRDHELAERFRADADSVMGRYQLDPEERRLLKDWNVRALYDRGASALLLMLAHAPVSGKSMQEYAVAMNPQARSGE
jgi:hypothetical protein